MKLKFSLLFSGLLGVMLLFSTAMDARSRGGSANQATPRYSGTSSYSSQVITQNQNYVATGSATTGVGSNPLGGADCDNEGICTKCRRLAGEALKSYCRENECSKASNAFIVAKALALSSTFVNIDANLYDSPSTAVQSNVIAQGQAYNQTLAQTCEPYLVKNVEELLPSFYDIVTDQCHEQYKTAIDHYMSNNQGGFLMGGNVNNTGQKRTIRNFELLEYFKAHNVNTYETSLYQVPTSEDYYFSDYCMQQMADEVKLSLIDLYIPDMYTYQRNMCRRSYEHAIQKYCVEYQANICHGEIDYMQVIMDQGFLTEVDSFNTQINCGTELAQDIREALTEEVVRKQNLCAREMGHYNAEKDMCQFTVALIDAKNKEIERKRYYEGESVQCNEKDFIDPYSKEGRKRVGKNWLMSEQGAEIMYGAGGALLGGVIGSNVGGNVARNAAKRRAVDNAGAGDKFAQLKTRIQCPNGETIVDAATDLSSTSLVTQAQAETILNELCLTEDDGSGNITISGWMTNSKTGRQVGTVVGGVAGGAVGAGTAGLLYKKFYKETKCYTTWRDANDENMSVLSNTDRPIAEWGGSKSFPTIVKGKTIQLDSLPVYDREYPGDPKWEDK